MNILFLTQYFPPEIGGASSRSSDLLYHLSSRVHTIVVVSEMPHYPSTFLAKKYRNAFIYREKIKNIRTFVFVSKRKSFIQRTILYGSFLFSSIIGSRNIKDIDVVVATSPPLTVGLAGWIISKWKNCKFVLDVRDLWPESIVALGEIKEGFIANRLKVLEHFLYTKADKITIAVPGFRKYITDLGIADDQITDLPNGANLEIFYFQPDREAVRKQFDWQDKFMVLFSGNHGLAQGLHYLLETACLMQEYQDIVFVFIGDGVEKSKMLKEKDRSHLETIIFLDVQKREQMSLLISAADICVVPLVKHPLFLHALPSKMFEYMACERPIITSIDGEARKLIEASNAGIFVEPENVEQMKTAILRLHHNKNLRRIMGKNGRRLVAQHFCRKMMADKFEKCLMELNDTKYVR
jgi:glycosyltransferase involved in cell wall biosynthesis